MNKDLLIGKVATILGKSFNEVAFHMNTFEQIEALVNLIEKGEK
jgi:hypothetical protein